MINIPDIYNDPILFRKRQGNHLDPFREIKESITVEGGKVILNEVPNREVRVKASINGIPLYEIEEDDFLKEDTFKVNYTQGYIDIHESLTGKTIDFEYTGEGVYLFPDSRVYRTNDFNFPTLRDKIDDVDREILNQKSRVDTLIIKNPQPSEVVDLRIDRNGKIFSVAKDRIDAEQFKIEEAYIDAFGVRHESLKKRIDSLQLATKERIDKLDGYTSEIDSQLKLVPGQITAEVGELKKYTNGEIERLTSMIDLVPGQISLEVNKVKQWADGEFSKMTSSINILPDMIEAKVDVDGVISAINLSREGVKITGDKIWITGETRIDKAAIKSAHIESIDASKIKTGTLNALNITSSTIEGSLIRGTNIYVDGDMPEFLYANAIDTNPETRGVHIYIRPTADGEVRTTKTHTRDQYVPIRTLAVKYQTGKNGYMGLDGELRVMSQGLAEFGVYRDVRANIFHGVAVDLSSKSDAVNLYLRPSPSGEVRITRRGTTDRYRPIAASDFKIRSSRDSKENITKVKSSGLDVINSLSVVNFNYKGQNETEIGIISQDSPQVSSADEEFVNMSSILYNLVLSVQELSNKYNNHSDIIDQIKKIAIKTLQEKEVS